MKSGVTQNKEPGTFGNDYRGFTLVELMIAVGLFSLVIAGSLGVYIMCQRMWCATSLSMDTSRMASLAIERMVYGVGTNSGLRAAATASIAVDTNKHTYIVFTNYWDSPGGSPPPANHWANLLSPTWSDQDGSWRIICSNAFDGENYIDYVKKNRSIVMWPNINPDVSRLLICNYVSSATVTSTNGTVSIQLTVWKKDGAFVSSNQVSAFIKMRN